MKWVDEKIEHYRSRLHTDDRDDFNDLLDDALATLDEDEIRDELESEISKADEHFELIAEISSGFSPAGEGSNSGYVFAFTEPLEEQNQLGDERVKNGDILLINEQNDVAYLCVIECKSGTCKGSGWVNELHGIRETLDTGRYRQIIKQQLGIEDKELKFVQYVLAGKLIHTVSMDYEGLRDNEDVEIPDDFAFWGFDFDSQSLVHVYGDVRHPPLKRPVASTIDTGIVDNNINFTYSEPPVIQLSTLIENIIDDNLDDENENEPFEFDAEEFYSRFDQELQVGYGGEEREKLVTDRVERLLEIGKRIEALTNDDSDVQSERDYRILFRGRKAHIAADAATEKYFDYMAVEKKKERAFDSVRSEFTPKQTRLDDIFETNEEDKAEDGDTNDEV